MHPISIIPYIFTMYGNYLMINMEVINEEEQ